MSFLVHDLLQAPPFVMQCMLHERWMPAFAHQAVKFLDGESYCMMQIMNRPTANLD